MTNTIAKIACALVLVGCGGSTQKLIKDPSPITVSAAAAPKVEPPPPPARVEVKADAIQVNESIYFVSGSGRIRSDSHGLLDEIANVLKAHPELVKIRIEGHTDSVGPSRSNLVLSQRRAASVRKYLVEHGIDPARLIAEGFGQDNAIAENDTEEGRAKNRRVAFTVLDRDDEVMKADVANVTPTGGAK